MAQPVPRQGMKSLPRRLLLMSRPLAVHGTSSSYRPTRIPTVLKKQQSRLSPGGKAEGVRVKASKSLNTIAPILIVPCLMMSEKARGPLTEHPSANA